MGSTRRRVLLVLAPGAAALALRGAMAAEEEEEAEVGPAEDLMREHGVLRRVMFLYDEAARLLAGSALPPLDALGAAAAIVKRVIEDYHEKLEESFVFPRLEKAKKLTALTATLREQHAAGRKVTAEIRRLSKAPLAGADRGRLADLLRSFNRMYRPHAAREDTVLFPAFHDLLGNKAWAEMGEQFEAEEKKKLGEQGFEGAVAQVAKLEEQFGMADLAQFTPR
jgi:hemerythrin-like domain-containing protein